MHPLQMPLHIRLAVEGPRAELTLIRFVFVFCVLAEYVPLEILHVNARVVANIAWENTLFGMCVAMI